VLAIPTVPGANGIPCVLGKHGRQRCYYGSGVAALCTTNAVGKWSNAVQGGDDRLSWGLPEERMEDGRIRLARSRVFLCMSDRPRNVDIQ